MAKVNGGRLVTEALKRERVKYIFGLCGNQIGTIFDATIDAGIKVIDVRHEQAAINMADTWARLTRESGVAVVTGGAGTAHAIPGMITAFYAASLVVLIAAQASLAGLDTAQTEEMPQVRLLEPITKWAATCRQTTRIPEYISMAFRYACSGRKGPVFLEIPNDLLAATVEEEKAGKSG